MSSVDDRKGQLSFALAIAGVVVPIALDVLLAGFNADASDQPLLIGLGVMFVALELAAMAVGMKAAESFARSLGLYTSRLALGLGAAFFALALL